ncbi:hypothetical protein PO909_026684, partial [Leuciscus waleckii]
MAKGLFNINRFITTKIFGRKARTSSTDAPAQNTTGCMQSEGMNGSSAQPSTSIILQRCYAALLKESLKTPGREPTPASDALETETNPQTPEPST